MFFLLHFQFASSCRLADGLKDAMAEHRKDLTGLFDAMGRQGIAEPPAPGV